MSRLISIILPMAASLLSACASSQPARLEKSNDVGSAVQQPFRDLNLVRDEIPAILQQATNGPYRMSSPVDCGALAREIGALDDVLGPDVDQAGDVAGGNGDALAAGLVRGVVGFPFGGIVRNLTGAAARDREVRLAIVAGIAPFLSEGYDARLGVPICRSRQPRLGAVRAERSGPAPPAAPTG